MKYFNRRWVQVSLAIIATVLLAWYFLHKTAAGKKVAAKAAAGNTGIVPPVTTAPATTTPAPATTTPALAGNLRYN